MMITLIRKHNVRIIAGLMLVSAFLLGGCSINFVDNIINRALSSCCTYDVWSVAR